MLSQGTPGFISVHLLEAWGGNEETIHTHIDDLESCLWVIVCSALETGQRLHKSNDSRINSWLNLTETPPQELHPKSGMSNKLTRFRAVVPWVLRPLRPLLNYLFNITTQAQEQAEKTLTAHQKTSGYTTPQFYAALDSLVEDTFEKLFAVILEHLGTLPDTWE